MTQKTTVGKIFSYPNNPRVFKAQIAAKYASVEVEIDSSFEMGVTNKSADFLSKFPLGKVPAMMTPDGPLFESDAIAYYVASSNPKLLGQSSYEKALVEQYVSFAAHELGANLGKWYYPIVGYIPYNKQVEDKAKEDLKRALGALNAQLLSKTFLVGERVTLADIAVASTLYLGYTKLFDASFRSAFPNVNRWFLTCVNQPQFSGVLGAVQLCAKAEVYDAKKFKKEEPKKEKKAAAPKKDDVAAIEAELAAEAKEEKKKNPLDELPPSPFVLDAWKRFYSNNDPPQAVEYFWQNYDPQGYSMWKVDYKYNNELGLIFMSSNLIGGFFQRLDRARKYAFGSMIVTGENNANQISGYFIVRGQEVPFEITDAADYPSYQFTKVDPSDAKVKAIFNDYLSWEGSNLPGKFQDGKIFK